MQNLQPFKVKYVNQQSDLGMFYTTPNRVADKISLNAKVLTERYVHVYISYKMSIFHENILS